MTESASTWALVVYSRRVYSAARAQKWTASGPTGTRGTGKPARADVTSSFEVMRPELLSRRGGTSNIEHPTFNIQHPTSNIQHPTSKLEPPRAALWAIIRCWAFEVGCWMFTGSGGAATACFRHALAQEAQALANELFCVRTDVLEYAARITKTIRAGVVGLQHQPHAAGRLGQRIEYRCPRDKATARHAAVVLAGVDTPQ